MDAWRIEAAEQERQGMMAAAYQWGYRVAQILVDRRPRSGLRDDGAPVGEPSIY